MRAGSHSCIIRGTAVDRSQACGGKAVPSHSSVQTNSEGRSEPERRIEAAGALLQETVELLSRRCPPHLLEAAAHDLVYLRPLLEEALAQQWISSSRAPDAVRSRCSWQRRGTWTTDERLAETPLRAPLPRQFSVNGLNKNSSRIHHKVLPCLSQEHDRAQQSTR